MSWGELVNGVRQYTLHKGQTEVMRDRRRFVAAIAGTGGGKTVLGPLWLMREFGEILKSKSRDFSYEPIKGIITAPTYKVMSRATLPEFLRVFDNSPWRGEWKKADSVYTCAGGRCQIYALSTDNSGGLEGGQFDRVWSDEAGQGTYDSQVALVGRLGLRAGKQLITTTPYDLNWLKQRFVDLADGAESDLYGYHQWESIRNPAYPLESYEHARRTMSPARFRMRYHGEFSVPYGLVYPELFEDGPIIKDFSPRDIPAGGFKVGGMDIGWSPDPRATIVAVKSPPIVPGVKNHLWFYLERYELQEETVTHARHLPKDARYWIDPSVGEVLQLLRKEKLMVRKARVRPINEGIDFVTARLKTRSMTVHPRLLNLLKEARGFKWPMEDDVILGKQPEGEYGDHLMDAIRYVISSEDNLEMPYIIRPAA